MRVVVESLRIKNRVKNHSLAKSIHDQPWGALVSVLTYQAANAGGWVKRVTPKNTSQWGATGGALPDRKLTLDDRRDHGASCGMGCDRDIHAAINVCQVGLQAHRSGGHTPVHSEKEARNLEGQVEHVEPYALVT